MQPPATDLLFVYGTLRRGVANEMGDYLAANGEDLGAATCPGCIYNLGAYPGLVATEDGGIVHGQVFRLRDPAATLRVLDDYEGATSTPPHYERRALPVTLRASPREPVTAWVYVYLLPLGAALG